MEAFRIVRPSYARQTCADLPQLKPLCVPLMGLRPLTPQTQTIAHSHLVRLLAALQGTTNPKEAFTPSLVRYTLFPLTHLLTRNNPAGRKEGEVGFIADRTMEVLFRCLAWIMQRWWESGDEVDVRVWEQLWRMVVLILGGPIGSEARHEPRAEETAEAGVELLQVLVCAEPSEEMRDAVFGPGRRLLPVLFHTVSTLVEVSTTAISPYVSQTALQALDSLLDKWFADDDKARILAGIMPGIISAIVKIISGAPSVAQPRGMQTAWNDVSATKGRTNRKAPTTDVACAGLRLFSKVVILTIGDAPLIACNVLTSQVTDLESLVSDLTVNDSDDRTLIGSPTLSTSSSQTLNRADPFPPLTPSYLAFTRTQLAHSLNALLPPLTTHHASRVRLALVDALSRIAHECARALDNEDSPVQDILLSTLLTLGSPYEPSPEVTSRARSVLQDLMQERRVQTRLRAILERELGAFPAAVQAHSERRIAACVDVIMTLSILARQSGAVAIRRDFAHLLGPNGGVVKWSWPLLACLELARPVEMEAEQTTDGTTRAWDLARVEGGSVAESLSSGGEAPTEAFPRMTLVHVESRTTVDRIAGMLEALGGAAGVSGVATVEQLLTVAGSRRGGPVASAALWVVGRIVDGLAGADAADEKRVRRASRRIVDLVVQFDDDADLPMDSPEEPSSEVTTIERRRGLGTISKLLDDSKRTPTAAADRSRRAHAAVHRELVTCLHLSLLASCARILSTSFRRHLDATLYIILSHLGSPHAFVRRYAQVALGHVSYHAGYASAQNLILDNVDYVINRVSQRMTYDRLDTLAPMVLISMIKLVGEPIVPLVQDIIADIFDALDDFHGYALLASTVLAVMDTLMKAMAAEVPTAEAKGMTSTSVRMRPAPDPARDFATFTSWYAERAVKARQTMDELLERAPEEPWDRPKETKKTADEGPSNASGDTETPPTRAQEVCIQMMQKSIYFLTHANPFITARVLSLFASGVPVLISQERESDALPLIHQAWPSILNRLQDPAPFVRTEAAALVECLARWTGDFMSRRILDDAWPIFRQLLAAQQKHDDSSALAKRGVRGTTSGYTVSHRIYLCIIHAMQLVVQRVPIADDLFWEIVLAFRPFLDSRVHPELGSAAVKMYRCMAERDEDAVWLALNATMGTVIADQPLPTYLREPGLDIRHGVELIV